MKTAKDIEEDIKELSYDEYMKVVHWFAEYDWEVWNQKIETDSQSGKLDFLIQEALDEKTRGKLVSYNTQNHFSFLE